MTLLPKFLRLANKLLFTELRVPSWVVVLGTLMMLAYGLVGTFILSVFH